MENNVPAINNNMVYTLLTEYNNNINNYNQNINYIIRNLLNSSSTQPPTTPTTPTPNRATNRQPTRINEITDEIQRYLNTNFTNTQNQEQNILNTSLDRYLTRIAELLNTTSSRPLNNATTAESNTTTNRQSTNETEDNDLTISFSFMRELDGEEIPLYQLIATQTRNEETNITPLIYNNNTRLISFDTTTNTDINTDRICPISHEAFEEGEIITQINGCGHIFKTNGIKRWFERSPCCPKCRYNIITRQYPQPV
jgi:hypothetical protein